MIISYEEKKYLKVLNMPNHRTWMWNRDQFIFLYCVLLWGVVGSEAEVGGGGGGCIYFKKLCDFFLCLSVLCSRGDIASACGSNCSHAFQKQRVGNVKDCM